MFLILKKKVLTEENELDILHNRDNIDLISYYLKNYDMMKISINYFTYDLIYKILEKYPEKEILEEFYRIGFDLRELIKQSINLTHIGCKVIKFITDNFIGLKYSKDIILIEIGSDKFYNLFRMDYIYPIEELKKYSITFNIYDDIYYLVKFAIGLDNLYLLKYFINNRNINIKRNRFKDIISYSKSIKIATYLADNEIKISNHYNIEKIFHSNGTPHDVSEYIIKKYNYHKG